MARTRCFQYLNFPHILHFCSMRVRLSGCRSHLEVGPCCGPLLFRPESEWDIVMSQDVLSSVWAIAESLAFELGLDLVDVEQGGGRKRQVLRVFVDKPDGVGLADCERMSRLLAERLDAGDAVDFSYVLEVSSPGLKRPLRKAADFRRYSGRRISLRLRGREGKSDIREISGVLRDFENEMVAIDVGSGEIRSFPLSGIAKATLEVDWNSVFKEKGVAEHL